MMDKIRLFCLLALCGSGAGVSAIDADKPSSGSVYPEVTGAASFVQYCAVCHGGEGRGDGPMREGLTVAPSNLRRLSALNGGIFPGERVRTTVDGREPPLAHGTREMPIWGEAFKRTQGPYGERRAQERIDNLVEYLRTLQDP